MERSIFELLISLKLILKIFSDVQYTDACTPLSLQVTVVLDEFERIMYIVSNIFFIIIQLLYGVACVAVSNYFACAFT